MKLLELNKIWDSSPHNAFTDLIYFNQKWYCVFRVANTHMSYDGSIQVISSENGSKWTELTQFKIDSYDLRDPKFSITTNGELMINAGIRIEKPLDGKNLLSVTWFSSDGINFSEANFCSKNSNTWRWSTSWHKEKAYSFAYSGIHKLGALYTSKDGKSWDLLADEVFPKSTSGEWGNESSLLFIDDVAYCILRRDGGDYSSVFSISKAPYKKWDWKNLGQYVGGPKMLNIDGKFLVAGRLSNDEEYYTALTWLDESTTSLKELLRLPSKADSSYPGLIYKDGIVYMSYYSSHEGKSSIYFARIEL
jgi:hypothetical protein